MFWQPSHTSIDEYISEEISELTNNLIQKSQLRLEGLVRWESWSRRYNSSERQKMLYPKTNKQLKVLDKILRPLKQ